jgi:hypothetical protein
MDQAVLDLVMKQGVWAALFIWLFYNTTKKNEERELNYQKVIQENQVVISEQSKAFTSLAGDVSDIKTILEIDRKGE